MKKYLITLLLVAVALTGISFAEDEAAPVPPARGQRVRPDRPWVQPRGPMVPEDREELIKRQQERQKEAFEMRKQQHEKVVGELKSLKELALSENAKKTAAKIQEMIDAKEKDFKEAIEKAEQNRLEMQKRMEERQQQMLQQKEGVKGEKGLEAKTRVRRKAKEAPAEETK